MKLFYPPVLKLLAGFDAVYDWMPKPDSARAMLRMAVALFVLMLVPPIAGYYAHIWWLSTACLPLTVLMGWCAGRLIGDASLQRMETRWHDLDAFITWQHQQEGRITGWMVWSAASEACGAEPDRPAFDAWLAKMGEYDWQEADAWLAAVAHCRGQA